MALDGFNAQEEPSAGGCNGGAQRPPCQAVLYYNTQLARGDTLIFVATVDAIRLKNLAHNTTLRKWIMHYTSWGMPCLNECNGSVFRRTH